MRKQGGFTLIELMIVVAIIGVLAAIAIPRYQDYVTRSKVAAAMATLKSFQTPAEAYYLEKGEFPNSLSDIGGDDKLADTTAEDGYVAVSKENGTLAYIFNAGPASILSKNVTLTRDDKGWACTYTISDSDSDLAPKGCTTASTSQDG